MTDNDNEEVISLPVQNPLKEEEGRLPGKIVHARLKAPLITIITVVYNGAECLRQTIESVIRQQYDDLEYIIIDGGSTDSTLDVIKSYENAVDYWVSEPDNGIYDAMNKGIACSSGRYLLFLNAGDMLVANLSELASLFTQDCVMVYGKTNMLHPDGTLSYVKGKPLKSLGKLVRGTPLCHQAIFYRRDAIGRYDTRYTIIADRVLTYELAKRHGLARTRFVNTVIADYYEGGFSRQHEQLWRAEEFQFQISAGCRAFAGYRRLSWLYKRYVAQAVRRLLRGKNNEDETVR